MIAVCGEALVDEIHQSGGTMRARPGGGPFNTARAVARLGAPAAFVGHLSTDDRGRELARLLEADGVSLELATFGDERTTVAVADVDQAGRAEYRFDVDGTSAPQLTDVHLPAAVTAMHVGTLGLVLEPMASTLIALVDLAPDDRLVMLDPNIRAGLIPDAEYRRRLRAVIARSTIVKGSEADLAWLYPDLTYERAADKLLAAGADLVVVTLGAAGAYASHRGHRVRTAAVAVDLVDTIGAGDAFGAALLAWLHAHRSLHADLRLDGHEIEAALGYACRVAAITCSRPGADPPWKHELAG